MVWEALINMKKLVVHLEKNQNINRDELLRKLVNIQYKRDDIDFHRGAFRCRGDIVEIFPAHEDNIAHSCRVFWRLYRFPKAF